MRSLRAVEASACSRASKRVVAPGSVCVAAEARGERAQPHRPAHLQLLELLAAVVAGVDDGEEERGEQVHGGEALVGARINLDGVAVLDQGNGASDLRFRGHVTNTEAVRAAREAAVCDEGDVVAETRAHNRRGGRKHFRHARPALGALVPVLFHNSSSLLV